VVLADPLTVERLARAASLGLLSIAIAGDETSITDTFSEGETIAGQATNGPSP
jgi:hypothetical protein